MISNGPDKKGNVFVEAEKAFLSRHKNRPEFPRIMSIMYILLLEQNVGFSQYTVLYYVVNTILAIILRNIK